MKHTIAVNPIRDVVTVLQLMQKKVEAEDENEKDLFEKFMVLLSAHFLS